MLCFAGQRWSISRFLCLIVAGAACTVGLNAKAAHAQDGDGLYHRWDEDFSLMLGAGVGAAHFDDDWDLTYNAEVHALFFSMGGPMVAGRLAKGISRDHLILGVDIRPLFPALFFLYKPTWHEFWDLLIQSVSVELGAALIFDNDVDVAFAFGLGFEIPIARIRESSHRVALKLASRRIKGAASFLGTDKKQTEWSIHSAFVWYIGFPIGAASWEPRRYRAR